MFSSRKPTSAALLVAGTLLTGFGLAGCGSNDSSTPPTTVVTTPAPPSTVVTTPPAVVTTNPPGPNTKLNVNAGPGTSLGTDQPTADAVNKAIVTNKEMTGARVEAVVTDGVATLTGTVQNQQQKALAEKAATNTSGVTSVKNKLQITPTGGAKSASKPPVTKVIVVHKTVPGPPSPPAEPSADSTSTGNGTPTGTTPATPPAGTTGNGAPPAGGGTPAPSAPAPTGGG